ncbi:MAG TPA: hypothetical protein VEY71_11350 [Chitinophagales bacterium]|nr:hypothetical protein [Chitinophagales bacterium]
MNKNVNNIYLPGTQRTSRGCPWIVVLALLLLCSGLAFIGGTKMPVVNIAGTSAGSMFASESPVAVPFPGAGAGVSNMLPDPPQVVYVNTDPETITVVERDTFWQKADSVFVTVQEKDSVNQVHLDTLEQHNVVKGSYYEIDLRQRVTQNRIVAQELKLSTSHVNPKTLWYASLAFNVGMSPLEFIDVTPSFDAFPRKHRLGYGVSYGITSQVVSGKISWRINNPKLN